MTLRRHDRVQAQDALIAAALTVLDELRDAARELLDSAAYHRAAADDLRDEARRSHQGEDGK